MPEILWKGQSQFVFPELLPKYITTKFSQNTFPSWSLQWKAPYKALFDVVQETMVWELLE